MTTPSTTVSSVEFRNTSRDVEAGLMVTVWELGMTGNVACEKESVIVSTIVESTEAVPTPLLVEMTTSLEMVPVDDARDIVIC